MTLTGSLITTSSDQNGILTLAAISPMPYQTLIIRATWHLALADGLPSSMNAPASQIVLTGHIRRICPGKDIANQVLFIEFATFLWAFSVTAPLSDEDKPILPPRMKFIDQGLALCVAPSFFVVAI